MNRKILIMKKTKLLLFSLILICLSLFACSTKNTESAPTDTLKTDPSSATSKNDAEKQTTPETPAVDEIPIDMSGDYIGNTPCPEPPIDSTYTIYNIDNYNDCIVLYIENIDNGNFKFHLAQARLTDPLADSYTEETIFLEHIAHYNNDGFYEYIGKEYHLYFKYINLYSQYANDNPERPEVATDHRVEVYGFEKLFSPDQYGELKQYQNMTGNVFKLNRPFAG